VAQGETNGKGGLVATSGSSSSSAELVPNGLSEEHAGGGGERGRGGERGQGGGWGAPWSERPADKTGHPRLEQQPEAQGLRCEGQRGAPRKASEGEGAGGGGGGGGGGRRGGGVGDVSVAEEEMEAFTGRAACGSSVSGS